MFAVCIDVSRCFAWPRIRAANSDGEAEAFCLESHPRCEAKTWHRTKWPEVNRSKPMLMHARILRHWSWSKTSKIAARVFPLPVLNMSNPNALKLTKLRCWGRWKRRRPSAKRYTNSSPPLLARMGQVDFLWNYDDLNDLCWKSFNLQRAQADASGDGRLSYEELEAALQASAMQSSAVQSDRSDKHYDIECDESTTAGAWRRSLVEGFGIGNPWCLVKFQDARPPRYMPGEAVRAKWIEREKDSERERDGQHEATQQVPVKTGC